MTRTWALALCLLCVTSSTAATKKKTGKRAVVRRTAPRQVRPRTPVRARHATPSRSAARVQAVSYRVEPPSGATIENTAALVPFFEQLYRHAQRQALGPVRVLHFGDSHTASDDWAATIRAGLQGQFGTGGAGFSLAGRPYVGYRRFDVKSRGSEGWYSDGLVRRTGDGEYGLGGISLSTRTPGEWVSLDAISDNNEVWYLRQPGGGRFTLTDNGQPVATISTDGELGPGIYKWAAPGSHHLELRTLDAAPVRLFGWVTENNQGVTWETLGINGAQASIVLNWEESLWDRQVAQREPSLIVLAYGTNDASSPDWRDPDAYRAMFTRVLQKVRRAAPAASILVIGPPDRYQRFGRGWTPLAKVNTIIDAQRAAALTNGCSFWDLRAYQGGFGAMANWVHAGLAQPDYAHLSREGYQQVGRALAQELLGQYRAFTDVRKQVESENGQPSEDTRHREANLGQDRNASPR